MSLHLNYIYVSIDMFLHHITVYVLICLHMLYNIIIRCNSFWEFWSIYLLCMGYSRHCVVFTSAFELIFLWILYLCLLQYVCIIYTIYYLVLLHLRENFAYISSFILPMLPYYLTCIHNSLSTPLCLILTFSYHMHWNTYICIPTFFIYRIFLSILKSFYCFLILWYLFNFFL